MKARLLRTGVPIGLTIVAEAGIFIAVTSLIELFGTAALTAAAIANKLAAVTFMIPIAIAQASTLRVGNFAGSAHRANLSLSAGANFWISIAATAATMVILLIWPEFMFGLFLTGKDAMFAKVMALALPMQLLTVLFQIPDGVQAIAMSVLRRVTDTRIPAIAAITSFWDFGHRRRRDYRISPVFGPTGVWEGLLLGLSVASLILTMRMMRAMRRIRDGGRILLA